MDGQYDDAKLRKKIVDLSLFFWKAGFKHDEIIEMVDKIMKPKKPVNET